MLQSAGPSNSKIMLVGEFPSDMDLRSQTPFAGEAGRELGKMLAEAGIMLSTCYRTHVLRVQPPKGDLGSFMAMRKKDITDRHVFCRDKQVLPVVTDGIELLKREIELVQPNIIIAYGNLALWALTGEWGITSWRGSMMTTDLPLALDYKPQVIPTYNPGMVMRQWSWRPIVVHDLKRAKAMSAVREITPPDYKFIIRPDYRTTIATLQLLQDRVNLGPTKLSLDKETRARHIACLGIAWSALDAICIPFMDSKQAEGYWTEAEEAEIVYRIYKLTTHPNAVCVGQNFSYDAQYSLRHWLFCPRIVRDTMIAQHSCFGNMQKSLDFLSSMYCHYHTYWKDEGKEWDANTGEEKLWVYNCKDAVVTYEVDDVEQGVVKAFGMQPVHDFQQKLFYPVLRTMAKGIRPNKQLRGEFAEILFSEIESREQWLYDVLGEQVNIRSSPQMQDLFYNQLGERPVYNRKTGSISCDDEALRKISDRNPLLRPLVKRITELRSLGVFLSTFVNAPLDIDGRIRCSFNIAGTETYRFSSTKNAFGSGLNLQNIPKGGDEDDLELPNVRRLFIPDPGYTFFDIDLSSADLRIVVWEADEGEMKAMLREGLDPYTEIAKEFYHDPGIKKSDPRRQTFKSFAHGTHYLGTAKGLAERLGLLVHEAEKTQAWYFGRFKRIKTWQDDLKEQVSKRRMIQNIFGYRCYITERIEGTIFNEAAAWIPQSTVACLINRAYVAIDEQHKDIDILLQVHDSLAGQFLKSRQADAEERIVKASQIVLPYDDPLIIPVGIKTSEVSWGDCE